MFPGSVNPRRFLPACGISFFNLLSTYELEMLVAVAASWIGIVPHQGDQLWACLPINNLMADIKV